MAANNIIRFPRACRRPPPPEREPLTVRVLRGEDEWFVIYDGVAELHTNLNAALNDAFALSSELGVGRITIDR